MGGLPHRPCAPRHDQGQAPRHPGARQHVIVISGAGSARHRRRGGDRSGSRCRPGCAYRRRGVRSAPGSPPASSASCRALSRSISVSRARRTTVAFSVIPVRRCASRTRSSSTVTVVLVQNDHMRQLGAAGSEPVRSSTSPRTASQLQTRGRREPGKDSMLPAPNPLRARPARSTFSSKASDGGSSHPAHHPAPGKWVLPNRPVCANLRVTT